MACSSRLRGRKTARSTGSGTGSTSPRPSSWSCWTRKPASRSTGSISPKTSKRATFPPTSGTLPWGRSPANSFTGPRWTACGSRKSLRGERPGNRSLRCAGRRQSDRRHAVRGVQGNRSFDLSWDSTVPCSFRNVRRSLRLAAEVRSQGRNGGKVLKIHLNNVITIGGPRFGDPAIRRHSPTARPGGCRRRPAICGRGRQRQPGLLAVIRLPAEESQTGRNTPLSLHEMTCARGAVCFAVPNGTGCDLYHAKGLRLGTVEGAPAICAAFHPRDAERLFVLHPGESTIQEYAVANGAVLNRYSLDYALVIPCGDPGKPAADKAAGPPKSPDRHSIPSLFRSSRFHLPEFPFPRQVTGSAL